jgi:hypothetical protein
MKIADLTNSDSFQGKFNESDFFLLSISQKKIRKAIPLKKQALLFPDFMSYSRKLSSGEYSQLVKSLLSTTNLFSLTWLNLRYSMPTVPLSGVFWSALIELSLSDISSANVPLYILHPTLVDLAIHSNKPSVIYKISKIIKRTKKGKLLIWSRNINHFLKIIDLNKLKFDGIIVPLNEFKAGQRNGDFLLEERFKDKIIISDYSSHFKNFKELIPNKNNLLKPY